MRGVFLPKRRLKAEVYSKASPLRRSYREVPEGDFETDEVEKVKMKNGFREWKPFRVR